MTIIVVVLLAASPVIADDWAEVDISGFAKLDGPGYQVVPTISTVYYFNGKGIGLQYGSAGSDEQEGSFLTSWRVWHLKWGKVKNRALSVHVLGRVTNEFGEKFDFSNGDVGFEFRPDFNVDNKVTTCFRLLWAMEKGEASQFTVSLGVQFDIT